MQINRRMRAMVELDHDGLVEEEISYFLKKFFLDPRTPDIRYCVRLRTTSCCLG
jgi:hypothetical protein